MIDLSQKHNGQAASKCTLCNQRIPISDGCSCRRIQCNGILLDRVRFGDEEYDWQTRRCDDCGVYRGCFHHENCSREICPMCGELVILCDCETLYRS